MPIVKIQVEFPSRLAAELKVAAQRQGLSLTNWIRTTMETELERTRTPKARAGTHWLQQMNVDDAPGISNRVDQILYRD